MLREIVAEFNAKRQKDGPILSRNYDYMPTRPFSVPVSPDGRELDYSNTVNLKDAIYLSPFINGNPKYKTFNKLLSGQIQKQMTVEQSIGSNMILGKKPMVIEGQVLKPKIGVNRKKTVTYRLSSKKVSNMDLIN